MGRYYYGDIEGKFWFGLQPSDVLSRFGVEPNLSYSFCEDNIEELEEQLKSIEDSIDIEKLKQFFDTHSYYSNDDLSKANISRNQVRDYADWSLGKKVLDRIKEYGECNVECEI